MILPTRCRYATVTVLVPPEPPVIVLGSSAGGSRQLVAGDEVELRCESRGGKPASEVRQRTACNLETELIYPLCAKLYCCK